MREFFIFELKDEFKALYKDNPSVLFNIFEQIYLLKKEDINYGYSLFCQLTKKIDKEKMDHHLFIKYHQQIPYSKKKNIHYYNNTAQEEISSIEIKKAYMHVKTNSNQCFFFQVFNSLNNNFFVCDFQSQDYFFLEMQNQLVKV